MKKRAPIQSGSIVSAACAFVSDWCNRRVLKPLPSARFEDMGNIQDFEREAGAALIDLAEAARRIGLKRKTLYEWIRLGKLRAEHGLRKLGRRDLIDWSIFKACAGRGDFANGGSSRCL